ncbi:MAG: hypothetical protein ACI9XR_000620 [Flavobacterium sp.]|jgi:hypothetical protein
MNSENDKKNLLLDLIAFAQVDGELHDKEFMFLSLISDSLKITEKEFKELFHLEIKPTRPKSESERYEQFYKLALLMFSDGIKHPKEIEKLAEIGLFLALNPFATKRILYLMEKSPKKIIAPEVIYKIIQEQHN